MLNDTKKDLTFLARKLAQPYEKYSIDELANAYCDAVDTGNEALKDIYISALILRFWYAINKMYTANKIAPDLDHEDFFWWLYEAIEYACKYRGWRDESKSVNAQQCINKCIETIQRQKYYNLTLDKRKATNYCCSIDAVICESSDGTGKTLADTLESEDNLEDCYAADDAILLIQSYINRNKVIEAILLDNIAFNDVQRHFKKTVKTKTLDGEDFRYVEHSSEFWAYRLIQIVGKLPDTYRNDFLSRYDISEEKLDAVLSAVDKANNQKLYRMLDRTLNELRTSCALLA